MIREEEDSTPAKKLYQKPELRNYGSVTEITNSTSNMGSRIDSRSPVLADRTH
jgi:hypothetical protein